MDAITELIIKIVIFLIILFAVGYFFKRFAANGKLSLNKSKYIESIDRYIITNDKWLEIIKIGDKNLLIAITPQGVHELRELDEEDLHEIYREENVNLFASVLEKYTKK
ncbi:flagellar biosynthetic protein FliO [Clostridium sp. 'deep sea']|uniref:flagellar biosynthetic protein FliO n=1 Tax=Clostridium sp. 'deep sea' TaxID=2779445 RepID=UPI0018964649|nr:flagellar biosynthetic protein FliO [Clostridium sp. 'deep sea']QOR35355.1 flagellar biosynthetic protein FliO [Clostridium sp. 'deep sea']